MYPGTNSVNEIEDSIVYRVDSDIGYVSSGTNGYPINGLWCISYYPAVLTLHLNGNQFLL